MWSIDDNRITMLKKDMIVIRKIDAIFYPDWSCLENYISDSFLHHNIWLVDSLKNELWH